MTNDYCGWPTDAGNACQNPATEDDGRCWIDDHRENRGRPSKYNDDRAADAIEAAREGTSKAGCARAAGVGKATLARWLDKDPAYGDESFRNAFARARAQGERRLILDGLRDPDTDSQMARFLLASSFHYVKAERREITGEGGTPLEITLNEEVVETPYSEP